MMKYPISKYIQYVVFLLSFVALFFSCSEGVSNVDAVRSAPSRLSREDMYNARNFLKKYPDDLSNNRIVWRYYTETGAYDTLIIHADSIFNRTAGEPDNKKLWLYSGAFASQACVFSNKFDSASYYLGRIMPFMESEYSDDFLDALVYNTMAIYSLNTELDYSAALKYYESACASAERSGDMVSLSALLCNIATLYYMLRDSTGFDYALRAYELNLSGQDVRAYTMARSSVLLAQMYCLKGDGAMALDIAGRSATEISAFPELVSNLYLLYADVYYENGDNQSAEIYYKKAIEHERAADLSDRVLIYLRYADFLKAAGRYSEAKEQLLDGLAVSHSTSIVIHRSELLTSLVNTSLRLGQDEEALRYYQEFMTDIDSVLVARSERTFRQNQVFAKNLEIKDYKLNLMKARQKMILVASVSVLILVCFIGLLFVNRRQNRMYRRLVALHQRMLSQGKEHLSEDDHYLALWQKLDRLMKQERIYRHSDISLDRLAELLGTNRTYVSQVINRYAGTTFYNYIHAARIEEASRILSDAESDIPLKSLAAELGYNSISSFYRAFLKETGVPPSRYRAESIRMKSI